MSSISFGGLATGLDTGAIIAQLIAIKRNPIVRLNQRKTAYEAQIAALATLKTKLLALQTAAQNLDTANEFAALSATSSHEDLLTVTAGDGASPGYYDIVIHSRSVAQKDISQGFDSEYDSVGSGTISFTVDGETTELDLTGYTSLEGLKDLINDNVEGVNASLVYDGNETGGYRLVLTGAEAGTDGSFSSDFSGLSGGIAPVMTNHTVATDAHLTIDDIDVYASGNDIEDAISGVVLHLNDADAGQTIHVEVATDTAGIADQVQALVDAHNDLFSFIQTNTGTEGVLRDNPTLRTVARRMESLFSTSLEGGAGDISSFALIGVTRGEDRLLDFDQDEFEDVLRANYAGVRDFFIQRDGNTGKAYLIDQSIEDMTDSIDGLFKYSKTALERKIDNAEDTIERYERSVASYQITLERKFTAMESMVASLQAQGNYLSSMMYY